MVKMWIQSPFPIFFLFSPRPFKKKYNNSNNNLLLLLLIIIILLITNGNYIYS